MDARTRRPPGRPLGTSHWGRTGQGLVEFALVLPLLMLALLMTIDFGRVFLGWIDLNNMARIAANYAAQYPDAWGSPGDSGQQAQYQALIANDAAAINCTAPTPYPAPSFPDGDALGGRAQVRLTCSFPIITPLVSGILGGHVAVSASAVFPVRTGTVNGVAVGSMPPLPSAAASAGATAAPTPSPTPMCTVPNLVGVNTSQAQNLWGPVGHGNTPGAGFASNLVYAPVVPPNWTIGGQSLQAGTSIPCSSGMTVSLTATPTP
ncbi:MAG: TadE/TadG family type IV pilus assembly protein [Candidatus Limnocylindrales bacterium]